MFNIFSKKENTMPKKKNQTEEKSATSTPNAESKKPKKVFSEMVIKEIMFQKKVSRQEALKILEENHR